MKKNLLIFSLLVFSIYHIHGMTSATNPHFKAKKEQMIEVYAQRAKEYQEAQTAFRVDYQKCKKESSCQDMPELETRLEKLKEMEKVIKQDSARVMCIYSAVNDSELENCNPEQTTVINP